MARSLEILGGTSRYIQVPVNPQTRTHYIGTTFYGSLGSRHYIVLLDFIQWNWVIITTYVLHPASNLLSLLQKNYYIWMGTRGQKTFIGWGYVVGAAAIVRILPALILPSLSVTPLRITYPWDLVVGFKFLLLSRQPPHGIQQGTLYVPTPRCSVHAGFRGQHWPPCLVYIILNNCHFHTHSISLTRIIPLALSPFSLHFHDLAISLWRWMHKP